MPYRYNHPFGWCWLAHVVWEMSLKGLCVCLQMQRLAENSAIQLHTLSLGYAIFQLCLPSLCPLPTLPAHGLFTRKLTIQFPICNTNPSEQFQFLWGQFQATLQYLQNLNVLDFTFSHNNRKDSLVLIASVTAQFPSTLKTINDACEG